MVKRAATLDGDLDYGYFVVMSAQNILFLIYDGDCPVCSYCANVIQIQASVGKLEIINARTKHPLIDEVKAKGYDLNSGFVVKVNEQYYHGGDAVHFLALVGSSHGFFNRLNVMIFRSKILSKLFYPPLRTIRNTILWFKGVKKIPPYNERPIFADIFAEQWSQLPPVMKAHYANRSYSNDVVSVKGKMTITTYGFGKVLFPLFKLLRVWVPYTGKDIEVEVNFRSDLHSRHFHFERRYKLPNKKEQRFFSKMIQIKGNDVVELMPMRMGWRIRYVYENGKVCLKHNGYVFKFFRWFIPLPLGIFIGRINAVEVPTSHNTFDMQTKVVHPLFGKIYEYGGHFTII